MLPDNTFLMVIGFFTIACLLIFLVPVYVLWFHPRLDNDDIHQLNNVMGFVLCLPFFILLFIKMFLFYWSKTGSTFQAAMSLAVIVFMMGVVSVYSKLTGIKINYILGAMAGMIFAGIWLYTDNLMFAAASVGAAFVLLVILFIYRQYTQERVDLSSAELMNYALIGFAIISAILVSYYYARGSAYNFVGALCFCLLYLAIRYGVQWLFRQPENK